MVGRLEFRYEFKSSPSKVWRAIGDTAEVNRAAGLPRVQYRDEPQRNGITRRFASVRQLAQDLEYEELPFSWVHEDFFEVTRRYAAGPLSWLRQVTRLVPLPSGGCAVDTLWEWEPRGALGALVAASSIRQLGLNPIRRVYAELDERLGTETPALAPAATPPIAEPEARRVTALIADLRTRGTSRWTSELERVLIEEADHALTRMRPYAYARRWGADRRDVLDLFLAATDVGLLRMYWDVLCPHCRGQSRHLESLGEVQAKSFCAPCDVDFSVDLDRTLEVAFAPHPQIRAAQPVEYCVGGPGRTPHASSSARRSSIARRMRASSGTGGGRASRSSLRARASRTPSPCSAFAAQPRPPETRSGRRGRRLRPGRS